jgi:hypothetical protein
MAPISQTECMHMKLWRAMRLPIAAIVAPFISVFLAGMLLVGTSIFLVEVYPIALAIAYLAMLMAGLPMHAALYNLAFRGLVSYACAGAAFGVLLAFALGVLLDPEIAHSVEETSVAGAVCASVFWLIRRPDRDSRGVAQ